MSRLRRLLKNAWALTRPYWFSEDRWAAWGLLLAVVTLNLGIVFINVLLNKWNNTFYNSLQDKNYDVFVQQLFRFTWLAGSYIIVAVYQLYLNQMLQIRWRRWLTERYLGEWLRDTAYYRMQLAGGETDNPDQRIAEDLRLFVTGTLVLAIGGMRAVVTLVSFLAILWGLSGAVTLPVGGFLVTIPGYMVWAALLYAIVGTWLTDRIGRPLVRMNFDRQRYEADFRFGLVRFRENTEGVALYHGEPDELRNFRTRFGSVVRNWWDIMRQQKRLTWFTAGYGQAAIIFPFVVAAPRYFRGEIPLGGLVQTASAFGQVQDSLSFIVSSYTDIAEWRSVVQRLVGFEEALDRVRAQAGARDGIRREAGDAPTLAVENVDLALPGGTALISGVNLALARGESALLSGPSGAGKSTLIRAIAGIWPFGRGEIRVPLGPMLFLPQKPYLPIGTLREVISYPTPAAGLPAGELPAGELDDQVLREALEAVGLPELAGRLDEAGHWALQLSPGEQQRIAFARALVQKPDWLFLDEATSAVDEAAETRLYQLVRDRLRGTAVLSIGHRSSLRAFHGRQLVVKPNGSAPASIVEVSVTS
ncbi:MAG: ABC transporter ATP-binding protein/permease [Candidatus Rokubacteria bacterium]|nr:ABC transporter ATP-binding protein/permease [Candidatus Rokubacteria bacterium]